MKIEHIAIWVENLEIMKTFYEQYFGAKSNHKYHNPLTHFQSYFLSFEEAPGWSSCTGRILHNGNMIIFRKHRASCIWPSAQEVNRKWISW